MKSKFFLALACVAALAGLALGTFSESARGSQPAQDSHSASLVGEPASAHTALLPGDADASLPVAQEHAMPAWLALLFGGSMALGTVLTAPYDAKQRSGDLVTIPVAASTHLYPGGLIARDASGNAVPATDTAGLRVVGRNEVDADNSAGLAGAINATVARGIFLYANSSGDPIAAADVGNMCFVEDDSTVCKVGATNKIRAGRIVDVTTAGVYVDTRSISGAVKYTLTSAQSTAAAATDLTTSEALANDLKAKYNALQADVAAILAKLN